MQRDKTGAADHHQRTDGERSSENNLENNQCIDSTELDPTNTSLKGTLEY